MARTEHHPDGLIHYNRSLCFRGYTLFTGLATKAFLMDMKGQFVHQWEHPRGITNAELLPNGNTLIIKWDELPRSLERRVKGGYEGENGGAMLGDVVLEVTPEGKLKSSWNTWDELDPKLDIICPLDERREWTHANSISLSPKGDWVISFRRTSTVIQVSPRARKIRWRLNDPTISHQHDAKFTATGTMTLFDNGVHRKGMEYSRAVELDTRTRKIIWEYADNPPFSMYTLMGGCVDRLPKGNTLITETAKGHLLEVTPDKKVVWEYISPFYTHNPRLGGRMNMIFRAHRYSLDHAAFKGRDLDPKAQPNLNRLYGPDA